MTGHDNVFWFVLAWGAAAAWRPPSDRCRRGSSPGRRGAGIGCRSTVTSACATSRRAPPTAARASCATTASASSLGLAAVGYVQAAGTLMGPFLVIFFGISLVTVAGGQPGSCGARHGTCGCTACWWRGARRMGLAWGVALLVALPRGLGHLLLGRSVAAGLPAGAAVTISVMGACVIAGATAGLHALGAARRSLRAMVLASVVFLVCGLSGAYFGGAAGTVRGAALATWIGASLWWWQLRCGDARLRPDPAAHLAVAVRRRRPAGRASRPGPVARRGEPSAMTDILDDLFSIYPGWPDKNYAI